MTLENELGLRHFRTRRSKLDCRVDQLGLACRYREHSEIVSNGNWLPLLLKSGKGSRVVLELHGVRATRFPGNAKT